MDEYYALEVIGPWYRETITDEEGHQYITEYVNGSRQALLPQRYQLARCTDISHQGSQNVIPSPNLCTVWCVATGAVASAILDDEDMLVLEMDATARPGWIPEAREQAQAPKTTRPRAREKPVEKKEKPGKIGPGDAVDKDEKDKVTRWLAKHGVPAGVCDVNKAKWGEVTTPLRAYVSQLRKG